MNGTIPSNNFVNRVNAIVGNPRTQIQRRRMRDLQLNHYYKILAIKPIDTNQFGKQVLAHLISFQENEEFKVFLPSRMVPFFPNEEAVNQFLRNVTGLKVLSLADQNSVNLEFIDNREYEGQNNDANVNNDENEFCKYIHHLPSVFIFIRKNYNKRFLM